MIWFMKLKTVIVEDEKVVALHMRMVVQRLGHEVVAVVGNGEEVLSLAKSLPCDLLISDIRIVGEKDGVEIAEIIQDRCGCQVIFVTAYRDIETLDRAANVDFVGFLVKPFREDELETLVQIAAIRSRKESHCNLVNIDSVYSYCFDCATLFQEKRPIELTEKEHCFLRSLLETGNEFLSYEQLDQIVWGEAPVDSNTRRQLIYRFKRKAPYFPLKLVKGFGYRIEK